MEFKSRMLKAVNSLLRPSGCQLIKSGRLYEWQKHPDERPRFNPSTLPAGAAEYLRPDNPKLQELVRRYAAFDSRVVTPFVWTDSYVRPEDILYFRGDNAYVWQLRGPNMNPMAYALTFYYLRSIDTLGLLESLHEDELFGNYTFQMGGKLISRDLLDSIIEIYFMEKHLGLSVSKELTLIDIGAGYGRLAHRLLTALPNIQSCLCTDAVAVSSFLSEYYLRFRQVDRTKVIPVDEIETALAGSKVNIATNIHSFSECTPAAIEWWIKLLAKHAVKYLMVVPNSGDHGGRLLQTNDGKDFGAIIAQHGYKLLVKEPKYRDPAVQEFAINPTCHYLFEFS